jgi:hypothetical protein
LFFTVLCHMVFFGKTRSLKVMPGLALVMNYMTSHD